jgi:hypothetical protein
LNSLASLLRAVPSSIVIAIATFASFAFHVNFVVVSFIFLIVVVLQREADEDMVEALEAGLATTSQNLFASGN